MGKIKIPNPIYLLRTVDRPERLYEVFKPSELFVWRSKDGIDIVYDLTTVLEVYRRSGWDTWDRISIPALAGILERVPGMRVWSGDKMPVDDTGDGWSIVE